MTTESFFDWKLTSLYRKGIYGLTACWQINKMLIILKFCNSFLKLELRKISEEIFRNFFTNRIIPFKIVRL